MEKMDFPDPVIKVCETPPAPLLLDGHCRGRREYSACHLAPFAKLRDLARIAMPAE